jgi:importin subunit beta-1
MKSPNEDVALQGIEFWSSVCEEESELQLELEEAMEEGRPPVNASRYYARGALQYLVPILLQRLTEQKDCDDDDEWNPCKAAGVCLMLLSSCVSDDIIIHVMPFINENIRSQNWQFRDAAVMAFGSIVEGSTQEKLKPIVEQSMNMFIQLLQDPNVIVRDTATWTIGRICESVPEAVITEAALQPLLEGLVVGLSAEPRVARNACWSLSSIAVAAMDLIRPQDDEDVTVETYCLSKYFEPIIEKLLATTERIDANQNNLRSAAYEALMEMIKNSPKDCYSTVQKTTIVILNRLESVIQLENSIQNSSDRRQVFDLQSLLCATLQSVLRKVTPDDAPQISDHIMHALLHMLSQNADSKVSSVQEDAFLAVSTLIDVLGDKFLKYMDTFKPVLLTGLRNFDEHQVCQAAVGVVGDLGRNINNKIMPYCDEIMVILLQGLANPKLNQGVKPLILSTFGDIALAIGSDFKKYADVVLNALHQASLAQVDPNDFDMIDYLNDLREGCLDAYTGILQGLKGNNNGIGKNTNRPSSSSSINFFLILVDLSIVTPHLNNILAFLDILSKDSSLSDTVLSASCGLIGDLVSCFGIQLSAAFETDPVQNILTRGKKSKINRTKTLANWATKEIRKLKNI